ncbi:MAG TPA: NADH-quinone oxidoreductase subunit C [Rhizomicrobium sp.]|jgi:NADH-quinone oxidoreductase subunit C|nr:NADH-quinone oxidoreductase subunit C [Rhizomicrobium sp.]
MSLDLNALGSHIAAGVSGAVLEHKLDRGELTLIVSADSLPRVVEFLRDDPQCEFRLLLDICGVDWPKREKRFDVVYHFLSLPKNQRIRLKVQADEKAPIPSIAHIHPGANWFEREAYDMYGVVFSDHPDLRRILTDYGFDGYPLRKDFPLTGFVELRYDDELKRVVYQPVQLVQEFREFDFASPWEGMRGALIGDEKATKA